LSAHLHRIQCVGVVDFLPDTALIGHGGWADGRLGDYASSPVELNDHFLIDDFRGLDKGARLDRLHRLGDEAAGYFRRGLPEALARHRRVVALTHVPPFREACWHEGRLSNGDCCRTSRGRPAATRWRR
jgi:hypothetical protein